MAFAIEGGTVPRDHAAPLWRALAGALPWLDEDERIAIFPLRAWAVSGGRLAVNRRSRLMLRLPTGRVRDAAALTGATIDIEGAALTVGKAMTRALIPHGTLYAHRVAAVGGDEAAFIQAVTEGLAQLGIRRDFICGKRSSVRGETEELAGFSLMLTGLRPAESVRVQTAGLGPHRKLGFGIFVPHRSTAAVGSDEAAEEHQAFR
jgi:CRISPR-associated protein Cas6